MADQISPPAWLPPGWTMELKTRRDGKIDRYYTDPISGYVFRSMKDILRYVKTGEVGRLALKPKDKNNSNMELEDDKIYTPAVAEGRNSAESGMDKQISENQSLELVGVVKEEQNLESTGTGDCIPLSKDTSDPCREGAAVNSDVLPESKDLKGGGGSSDSTISSVSTHVVGDLPEKQQSKDVGRHRKRKAQLGSNKMKDPQLPRRTSKRLAGIEVDPSAELKASNRAHRVAARRSDKAESRTDENSGKFTTQEEDAGKREAADDNADKKPECPLVSPPNNPSVPEEHAGLLETDHKATEKPGTPPDLYSDPCIDFAIKTLTGAIPIEDMIKSDNHPCPSRGGDENKADGNPGCSVDSWTDPCIEFAIKTLTGAIPVGDENKAKDHMDLPFGDLWTDPCIEFAVKTLTGAIPVRDDLIAQNYFIGQTGSSETQGTHSINVQNVGLDFYSNEISRQQLHNAEKPLLKPQESALSNLPNTGNVRLQNPGVGGGLHQHVERRTEQRSRQTML